MPLLSTLALTTILMSQSVTVSNGPGIDQSNTSYAGNRSPLRGTPFVKLPLGSIAPKGWLLEYLKRQRNGLTGHLGEISAWLQKEDNAWLSKDGKGKWGWEEVPYWLKGYGNLGVILKDKQVIAETKVWIEAVLNSQREDGNFGPTAVDEHGVEDFWPKMIMLYCLQSFYEATGDERVVPFMTKFFRYQLAYPEDKFMKMYWQSRRIGDNLHSVLWLYNQTGDSFLLDLAKKIHTCGMRWDVTAQGDGDWFKSIPDWHNVNIAQGFREPGEYFQLSNDAKDLIATDNVFRTVRKHFGQVPGGMFGSDENARKGFDDPRQGVETCGMVEQMNSDEELLRITGDVAWADHAEDVAFNTYPAAVMPDFRSLRYITSPNMVLNDANDHHPGIANSGPFLMMNPFSSRCCQHNHSQGWPYYSENLWQATSDNGLAAVLYAANEVSAKVAGGVPVKLTLKGNYPFEDTLEFKVQTKTEVAFPLYLRVPGWCSTPQIAINGGDPWNLKDARGHYVKIDRSWRNGDTVTLRLPMSLAVRRWSQNHDSASVDYGPLTFSLKIGEEYVEKSSVDTAIGDSKWQPGADPSKWPSYEIHPATPWNYGLVLEKGGAASSFQIKRKGWPKDDFPFTQQSCPIQLEAKGRKIPEWKIDQYGLCGTLMDSPVKTNEPVEKITLIPMGAARLRISAFPVVEP
ncbi:MAG: glycoside hydrolase family 127 protein [Armatimonadetes bacterium]|nr:glycoside hydrolase family 127 protein [Armatimonadota bacterium]